MRPRGCSPPPPRARFLSALYFAISPLVRVMVRVRVRVRVRIELSAYLLNGLVLTLAIALTLTLTLTSGRSKGAQDGETLHYDGVVVCAGVR